MDTNCNKVSTESLEKINDFYSPLLHFLTKGLTLLKANTSFPLISVLPELCPQHASLSDWGTSDVVS